MVPKAVERGAIDPAGISTASVIRVFQPGSQTAKRERQLLISLVGKRGRWLLPIMGYATLQEEDDDTWETATHADRKLILSRVRRENPVRGIEMLRAEWKNESAQHRAELLTCLEISLSVADEDFWRKYGVVTEVLPCG